MVLSSEDKVRNRKSYSEVENEYKDLVVHAGLNPIQVRIVLRKIHEARCANPPRWRWQRWSREQSMCQVIEDKESEYTRTTEPTWVRSEEHRLQKIGIHLVTKR